MYSSIPVLASGLQHTTNNSSKMKGSTMGVALLAGLVAVASAWESGMSRFLTEKTFEHVTQASTGQTTGVWCVGSLPPAAASPPTPRCACNCAPTNPRPANRHPQGHSLL